MKMTQWSMVLISIVGVLSLLGCDTGMDIEKEITPSIPELTHPSTEGIIDERDSTFYPVVTIGSQSWLGKNLSYIITKGSSSDSNRYATCYDNQSTNCSILGHLYSRYALVSPESLRMYDEEWYSPDVLQYDTSIHSLCPAGWSIPTIDDWDVLLNHLAQTTGKSLLDSIPVLETAQTPVTPIDSSALDSLANEDIDLDTIVNQLRAPVGWLIDSLNSVDSTAFWALPSGRVSTDWYGSYLNYVNGGSNASWWTLPNERFPLDSLVVLTLSHSLTLSKPSTSEYHAIRCIQAQ
ncbi:MAG: hypothetical protein OCC49_19370 [Fibrobacterales bacterium]